jgi:hypothetical protein
VINKVIFVATNLAETRLAAMARRKNTQIIILTSNINKIAKNIISIDDILELADYQQIKKQTDYLINNWFLALKDSLVFENINFYELDNYELNNVFIKKIKILTCINKIRAKFPQACVEIKGANWVKNNKYSVAKLFYGYKIYYFFRRLLCWLQKVFYRQKVGNHKKYGLVNFDGDKFSELIDFFNKNYKQKSVCLYKSRKQQKKAQGKKKLQNLLLNDFFQWSAYKDIKKILKHIYLQTDKILVGSELQAVLAGTLVRHIFKRYPQYIDLITAVKGCYAQYNLQGVLLWNDELWVEKICVALARQAGIRSLVVQHGILAVDEYKRYSLNADLMAVFGDVCQKQYQELGFPAERLKVTGSLQADKIYYKKRRYDKISLKQKYGIKTNEKVVVFPILPLPDFRTSVVQSNEAWLLFSNVMDVLENYTNIKIFVKCRNKYDYHEYVKWGQRFLLENVVFVYAIDLHEILYIADMVITYYSTIVLESILLDTPVVIADFAGEKERTPYIKKKMALEAKTKIKLAEILDELIKENVDYKWFVKKAQEGIIDYIYKFDGKTSERIFDFLAKDEGD